MDLTVDELEALEILLSCLHKKDLSYTSELTGQMYTGKFFLNEEEYNNLLKVETIIEEELKGR